VRIGYEKSGAGPALLLVHGTTSDRTRWQTVSAVLSERFALYNMDRRGRGSSGDDRDYDIAREFGDVASVADSVGPVTVVAHSFGAVCGLEAALKSSNIERVVLYEPPISVPGQPQSQDESIIDRIDTIIAANQSEAALLTFYREILRAPEAETRKQMTLETWPDRVALAHTIPRELRAVRRYRLDAGRASRLNIPVLLMVGAESLPRYQASTKFLAETLPHAEVVSLPGQQHNAITMAPDLFANAVLDFLDKTATTRGREARAAR
jgi:pimeloyl-ACP methyl ester carboxylesterase